MHTLGSKSCSIKDQLPVIRPCFCIVTVFVSDKLLCVLSYNENVYLFSVSSETYPVVILYLAVFSLRFFY